MEIINLDKHSKIIIGLYHFSVPFILSCPALSKTYNTNDYQTFAIIFWIALIISVMLLICGLNNYRNFAQIDEKYIYFCTYKNKKIELLKKIEKNDVEYIEYNHTIHTKQGENIRILKFNFGILFLLYFLTFPSSLLLLYKIRTSNAIIKAKLGYACNIISQKEYEKIIPSSIAKIMLNISAWVGLGIYLFIVFVVISCFFTFTLLTFLR